tara:strand:+ start:109 stop:300 length:192 start_codon:yes stop_codon:yes gene_type:complete
MNAAEQAAHATNGGSEVADNHAEELAGRWTSLTYVVGYYFFVMCFVRFCTYSLLFFAVRIFIN